MDFLDVMHTYFRGERIEAAFFIAPVGLLFLGLAFGAWRSETGGYMLGALIPAALFGLVLLATGVGLTIRTPGQVAALEQAYQESPTAMVADELPRMRTVESNFRVTLVVMGVLAGVGLVLRFALPFEWAQAAGPVLAAAGSVGLLIDGFAARRAEPYMEALEQVAARVAGG